MKSHHILHLLVKAVEEARMLLEKYAKGRNLASFSAATISVGQAAGIYKVYLSTIGCAAPPEVSGMMIGLEDAWKSLTQGK